MLHLWNASPLSAPVPLQAEQETSLRRGITVSTPLAASSKDMFIFVWYVWPFLLPPDPPNPKISPKFPNKSPKSSTLNPWPPKPPKPEAPIARTWSYSCLFLSSPKTELASEISLNFFSASVSPGFKSGWFSLANFLYAFFMSSVLASFETPSVA